MNGNGTIGGLAYGSLYKPIETGSSGGGLKGGHGGGKVKIRVPAVFLLDGHILADGEDGGTNSGGGSGGSVFVEAGQFFLQFPQIQTIRVFSSIFSQSEDF